MDVDPTTAKYGAACRSIPDSYKALAGTGADATQDLAAITPDASAEGAAAPRDLRGRWIFLEARGGDVDVLLNIAIPAASRGKTIRDGESHEFFVLGGAPAVLHFWGAAGAFLDVLWDSKVRQ